MMKSLYSGVAGLKVHNQRMDVIGNNISNVNTTAFKASTVTFKDIFYQNKSRASSGTILSGGTNANQVGYGAAMGTIAQLMTQSGLVYSDRVTDCAIQGEGFFQVMDDVGNIYYTRAGVFHIDNYGNLCDPNGNIVLGVSGDPSGVAASSQRINLYVPPIDDKNASVTKTLNLSDGSYTFTVSASTPGEEGNLSINFVDSKIPFASQNGSSVVVYMDFEKTFGRVTQDNASAEYPEGSYNSNLAVQEFQDALNEALEAGGVDLPDGVLPLTFEFDMLPTDNEIGAATASNNLIYSGTAMIDDDDDPTNDDVEKTANIKLGFRTNAAGDFTNSYEIDLVANSNVTEVKARWDDNVLVITVPTSKDTTLQEIQDAIDAAAKGNEKRMLTVYGVDDNGEETNITTAITADDAKVILKNSVTPKVGLKGGKDNFFKTLMESVGTIKLTDGRRAAEQTTEDLKEIFIDDDGVIYGVHTVHGTIAMGRIDLVLFENPEGLNQVGTSYWSESLSSGEPMVVTANDYGSGAIVSEALEMSNADLAQEISDMIITQRGYQANTRVITVTDQMLEELVNLKR